MIFKYSIMRRKTRVEMWRIEMANLQWDKMSKLEFVAIQFGVKFTGIWNLGQCVDKVCSDIYIILFISKTLLFHTIISLFFTINLLFQDHIVLFLMWFLTFTWPFWKRRKIAAILLAATGKARQRGLQPYLHPLETFKWLMSGNKHSSLCFKPRGIDWSNESRQSRRRCLQRGLNGRLKAGFEGKFCYWEVTQVVKHKTQEK